MVAVTDRRLHCRLQQKVQQRIKADGPIDRDSLARQLWHAGIPNRLIQLPESWWTHQAQIDSGLWISFTPSAPSLPWLVSHEHPATTPSVLPLRNSSAASPPEPQQLDRLVLSLWPGVDQLSNLWRLPPSTLINSSLEALLWLLLPIGLIYQPAALAVILPALALLRSRHQPQRTLLITAQHSLAALHHLLRLPVASFVQLQHGVGQGVINLENQLGRQLPEQLLKALLPLLLLSGSGVALMLQQAERGRTVLLILALWSVVHIAIAAQSRSWLIKRDREDTCSDQRSLQLLTISNTLRLAGAEERALAWWQQPLRRARSCQQRVDLLHSLNLLISWLAAGSCLLLARQNGWSSLQLMQLGLAIVAAQQLGKHLHNLVTLRAESRLESRLLASPTEWQGQHQHPGILQGDVQLKGAWFRYDPTLPWVLEDVNLALAPGSFTALVGPSGSGKSTLLQLMLGFGAVSRGQLLFDQQDARTLQQDLLRPQIGAMLQNGRLVGDTLLDVLAAGRPLELEQALQALDSVGFGPDLQALPMGLETPLPDGGRQLSGGQRQKLALARALIGSPPLLLLDEPTSALDAEGQNQVLKTMLSTPATRLLVAHRLSTIKRADRIVVMDQGRIVQAGTFAELQSAPGLFAQLIQHQDS
ncbi:MAG: hypothetical protein CBC35_09795 [Planctomycetes bacterium TMED75]|nr:MAG: hypothetical protein CBC35_09795 [Planctomycetes bacterium TMED75]